jgi:hypothetical protein
MTDTDWENLPAADGHGPWSRTDHLLAINADRVAQNTNALIAINSPKGKQPKPPEPIRRPGVGAAPRVDPVHQQKSALYATYLIEHQGEAPPPDWDPFADGGDLDG